jgi:exopolysaccharide biosynthesis polyprenyl glycosylphosphotransferase
MMQARKKILLSPKTSASPPSALVRPRPKAKVPANIFLLKLYRLVDVCIGAGSPLCAYLLTNLDSMPVAPAGFLALRITVKNLLLLAAFAFLWSNIARAFGLYENRRLDRSFISRIIASCTCGSFCALLFPFMSRAGLFGLDAVLLSWAIATGLTISARLIIGSLTGHTTLKFTPRHVLIVGTGARALGLSHEISARAGDYYKLLGFIDVMDAPPPSTEIRERMLGDLSQLESILVSRVVDEVLITLPVKSCYTEIQNAIRICERVGVESKYLAEIFQPSLATAGYEQLEGFAVTSLKVVQDDSRFFLKRALDIAGASLGLMVLSPLMLVIAILIKLTSRGPVIFSQERYGRNKRRFKMYKFRTMITNAEALQHDLEHRNEMNGPVFKIKNDPRTTRLGRVLRRTSLDELPQLFNILCGEMSLVGPRPLPLRDVSRFEEGWLMRRFCVVPGLTGLWQVNGRSNNTNFDQWVELDLSYIDNWSFKLDLKILAKTIPAVLKGAGAV